MECYYVNERTFLPLNKLPHSLENAWLSVMKESLTLDVWSAAPREFDELGHPRLQDVFLHSLKTSTVVWYNYFRKCMGERHFAEAFEPGMGMQQLLHARDLSEFFQILFHFVHTTLPAVNPKRFKNSMGRSVQLMMVTKWYLLEENPTRIGDVSDLTLSEHHPIWQGVEGINWVQIRSFFQFADWSPRSYVFESEQSDGSRKSSRRADCTQETQKEAVKRTRTTSSSSSSDDEWE